MGHPHRHESPKGPCQVIDFDEALLNACPLDVRTELMAEARLLAGVFAPGGGGALERMATQLSAGERDREMQRAHARRLAAALRRLARGD
jgi:hypothetical protein